MSAVIKRRPRRIAADEAHSWARNLRLGNSLAKLVLSMCTLYVDPEGRCYPGIESLAEDTELSPDTVRKRLAWLEQVGAIARFPQWIDDAGRRNGDGRGKRTSDEIRLMMNADPDDIEARAKGETDDAPDEISPLPQQGLNPEQPPAGHRLALDQPSDSGEGQDSLNHEPELNPPNPPSGGGQPVDQDLEDAIAEFVKTYPAPITNLPRLRTLLAAMTAQERRPVLTAVKGYASFIADCERKGKARAVKDADRWVAGGLWQGYLASGERVAEVEQMQRVPIDSEIGRAVAVLCKIAGIGRPDIAGTVLLKRPLSAQGLAFAGAPPETEWTFIPADSVNQVKAYDELIARELVGKARPMLVHERNRGGARGFMAPWPWPPRKDGSLCTGPPDVAA